MIRALLISLLIATIITPTILIASSTPDPSISTHATQCLGPFPAVPPLPAIPHLCFELGFASCDSFALNFTLSVNDIVVESEEIPSPLTFTYPYQLSSSCVANVGL